MNPPKIIAVKINVTKLLKEHFFKGKNGTYADITLILRKDGEDQSGNHYSAAQNVGKEARERGEKGPFVGDAKVIKFGDEQPTRQKPAPAPTQAGFESDDDIPF
ncbi:MAG: hypothetical protein WCL08_01065 [Verrucomicrobiota bacterium]